MSAGKILIVEDDDSLREALGESLELDGFAASAVGSGAAALAALSKGDVDLVLSDVQMDGMDGVALLREIKSRYPELPVVLMTAYGTIQKAVEAMREGASHYLVKPFQASTLSAAARRFIAAQPDADTDDNLIARDPRSLAAVTMARRVAGCDATVLLSGESGTGKEVFARFIHRHSARAAQSFVAINCAAIPESMLEAVLFGHEKGAFTGATSARPGKFEQAQNGTLLLDEISEMDLGLQAKLLRVLQEQEVERIGGQRTIALNVRVLATTNRDLRSYVDEGKFREDLYYRLNVFPIALPALRERPGDIVPLAEHILQKSAGTAVTLSEQAQSCLLAHAWPGNVRELDNLLQRGLIMRNQGELQPQDLCFETPRATAAPGELRGDLQDKEEQLILAALNAGGGTRKEAAQRLGISPRTLRYKIARLRDAGVTIPTRANGTYA